MGATGHLSLTTFSVHTVHTKETQVLTSQHKYLTLKNWKTILHPVSSRSQTPATGLHSSVCQPTGHHLIIWKLEQRICIFSLPTNWPAAATGTTGEGGAEDTGPGIEPSSCPLPDTADGNLAAETSGMGILGVSADTLIILDAPDFRALCPVVFISGGGGTAGDGGGVIKGVLGISTFGITGTGSCGTFSAGGLGQESNEDTADRMVGILDEADFGGGLGMFSSGTDTRWGLMLSRGGDPRPETQGIKLCFLSCKEVKGNDMQIFTM